MKPPRMALLLALFPVGLLFAASACAQNPSTTAAASACGTKSSHFDVKREQSQHAMAQPEPGKALVYFVQDIGIMNCLGSCFTTRIGMDGAWVGAIQDNSYFQISVQPGEHHLCARPQSHLPVGRLLALAHFTAEAGKIYYFRSRIFGGNNQILMDFEPLDSDQAKYVIASLPLSVSHPAH